MLGCSLRGAQPSHAPCQLRDLWPPFGRREASEAPSLLARAMLPPGSASDEQSVEGRPDPTRSTCAAQSVEGRPDPFWGECSRRPSHGGGSREPPPSTTGDPLACARTGRGSGPRACLTSEARSSRELHPRPVLANSSGSPVVLGGGSRDAPPHPRPASFNYRKRPERDQRVRIRGSVPFSVHPMRSASCQWKADPVAP